MCFSCIQDVFITDLLAIHWFRPRRVCKQGICQGVCESRNRIPCTCSQGSKTERHRVTNSQISYFPSVIHQNSGVHCMQLNHKTTVFLILIYVNQLNNHIYFFCLWNGIWFVLLRLSLLCCFQKIVRNFVFFGSGVTNAIWILEWFVCCYFRIFVDNWCDYSGRCTNGNCVSVCEYHNMESCVCDEGSNHSLDQLCRMSPLYF